MRNASLLTWLCKTKATHYESHKVPKRRGGYREINNPDKFLRLAQARILTKILNLVEVPDYTWAFEQGRSVPEMSQIHVGKPVVISLDLKDFFPSITQSMIAAMLEAESLAAGAAARTISELCTYRWYLPQGGITSPKVSNLIVKNTFGPELKGIMDPLGLDFTVYADDITISAKEGTELMSKEDYEQLRSSRSSGNAIGLSGLLVRTGNPSRGTVTSEQRYVSTYEIIREVQTMLARYGFRMNHPKTKVMAKNHRQMVCGVVVNDKPNLPQKERRRLRAIVHNVCNNGVEAEATKFDSDATVDDFLNHLKGKLNWFRMLNPEKGNALFVKLMTHLGENPESEEAQEVA